MAKKRFTIFLISIFTFWSAFTNKMTKNLTVNCQDGLFLTVKGTPPHWDPPKDIFPRPWDPPIILYVRKTYSPPDRDPPIILHVQKTYFLLSCTIFVCDSLICVNWHSCWRNYAFTKGQITFRHFDTWSANHKSGWFLIVQCFTFPNSLFRPDQINLFYKPTELDFSKIGKKIKFTHILIYFYFSLNQNMLFWNSNHGRYDRNLIMS